MTDISLKKIIYFPLVALNLLSLFSHDHRPNWPESPADIYLFKLWNIFLQITKYICPLVALKPLSLFSHDHRPNWPESPADIYLCKCNNEIFSKSTNPICYGPQKERNCGYFFFTEGAALIWWKLWYGLELECSFVPPVPPTAAPGPGDLASLLLRPLVHLQKIHCTLHYIVHYNTQCITLQYIT